MPCLQLCSLWGALSTMDRKGNQSIETLTTAQKLGSIVKSARDIMRKDKGNGTIAAKLRRVSRVTDCAGFFAQSALADFRLCLPPPLGGGRQGKEIPYSRLQPA